MKFERIHPWASLERMQSTGFSIAISPRIKMAVRTGQELARIVLLGPESLCMS